MVAPPGATRRTPGWWRRNWWGLLAVLPLFALAVAPDWSEIESRWGGHEPTQPVAGAHGQWVTYAGGKVRLTKLAEATLTDYGGKPFTLPDDVQIWQATLEFDVVGDDADLNGCNIILEDERGRTYDSNPPDLSGADIDYASCLRPTLGPKDKPFSTVATFVTGGTQARGVRIIVGTETPRYAWLTPPD
jgi:hypothetical protein